jgi:hypothetical protein
LAAPDTGGTPLWPFLLGGSVLMGGLAVTSFLIADAKADCANNTERIPDTDRMGCTDDEQSEIERLDVLTVSAAIASGALLTASAVLFLGSRSDSDAGARALLGPGYVGLAGRF